MINVILVTENDLISDYTFHRTKEGAYTKAVEVVKNYHKSLGDDTKLTSMVVDKMHFDKKLEDFLEEFNVEEESSGTQIHYLTGNYELCQNLI